MGKATVRKATHQRCSREKVLWKYVVNVQENNYAEM